MRYEAYTPPLLLTVGTHTVGMVGHDQSSGCSHSLHAPRTPHARGLDRPQRTRIDYYRPLDSIT